MVIFVSQGTLLPHYDIKCIGARSEDGLCPQGQLNPYYSANRYFYLDTEKYWKTEKALSWTTEDFEKDLFIQYNCEKLRMEFEGDEKLKKTLDECDSLTTVMDLTTFPIDTSDKRAVSTITDTPDNVEKKVYKDRRIANGLYMP